MRFGEATDGVVGHATASAKENHPGGSAATPPKEGNFRGAARSSPPRKGRPAAPCEFRPPAPCPSRTGRGPSRRQKHQSELKGTPIPLLRRGGSREATDGVVGQLPAHAKKTTPAAPPPPLLRRGIIRGDARRRGGLLDVPDIGFSSGLTLVSADKKREQNMTRQWVTQIAGAIGWSPKRAQEGDGPPRRFATPLKFPSLGGVAVAKRLTGWSWRQPLLLEAQP